MVQAVVVRLQLQQVERGILLPHLLTEVMERLPIHSKDETEVLDQQMLLLMLAAVEAAQMLQLEQVLMALAQVVEQVEQVLRRQSQVLPQPMLAAAGAVVMMERGQLGRAVQVEVVMGQQLLLQAAQEPQTQVAVAVETDRGLVSVAQEAQAVPVSSS
jgi:hypothetical protein